jgi:hypothetical protein
MDFAQQVVLIVLTAALSTLLIPLIFRWIDWSREKREKDLETQRNLQQIRFEADLARQSKIIDAQDALLNNLSQQLWRFRYLAMAVSLYPPSDDFARSQEAAKSYDEDSWDVFNKVRVSISESRRLVSERAYADLLDFYRNVMVPFDKDTVKEVIRTKDGYDKLNRCIYDVFTVKVEEVIYRLSKEVQLTAAHMRDQHNP